MLRVVHPCLGMRPIANLNIQIAAGIISLLNDYLLSEGEKPLGFLNPWLYGRGLKGLNDITSGSNPGCGTDGFTAIAGWDPVRPPNHSSLHFYWLILGSVHRLRV
jgi:tripeptidyl-peptidase-1